ncbi:MAG: hypothetical protein OJF49_000789 [Ktedonobacterales bacterium]|nr:MAG: hypothetical protein OJF49_000789 [Ktedonobacterales bacterium]
MLHYPYHTTSARHPNAPTSPSSSRSMDQMASTTPTMKSTMASGAGIDGPPAQGSAANQ